jgi:hypothetical protein
MTCHDFDADIVDLARDAIGGAAAERVEQHVEGCEACAGRLARERALSHSLKALAEATPDGRFDGMETCLLAAFSAVHPAAGAPAPPRASVDAWRWLGVAATVVIAAAVWAGWTWRQGQPRETTPGAAVAVPAAPAVASAPAVSEDGPGVARDAATPPTPLRRVRPQTAGAGPSAADMRFVPLPTAAGLPELESGRVVRVEFSMSELPAYGIEIAPDAGARVVEADVLVGQDGQPRAIRFVNSESDSRRR